MKKNIILASILFMSLNLTASEVLSNVNLVKEVSTFSEIQFDQIEPGETIDREIEFYSDNGNYFLIFQNDGNLVLYKTNGRRALWSSGTANKGATKAIFQEDGNLVVYANKRALYATQSNGGTRLVVQGDGNLVIYKDNTPVWNTKTTGR